MPTRNVVLTDHHEKIIADLVGSGRYQNASEVLREGLRLIEQRDAREAAKLIALRQASQIGFDDLSEGRYRDSDDSGLDVLIGRHAGKVDKPLSIEEMNDIAAAGWVGEK